MFRQFVFLSAGSLALLWGLGIPCALQANHAPDGPRPGFRPDADGFRPAFDLRFVQPGSGGFDRRFDPRFMQPDYGGFRPGKRILARDGPTGGPRINSAGGHFCPSALRKVDPSHSWET
jgi:hypothetical protein